MSIVNSLLAVLIIKVFTAVCSLYAIAVIALLLKSSIVLIQEETFELYFYHVELICNKIDNTEYFQ